MKQVHIDLSYDYAMILLQWLKDIHTENPNPRNAYELLTICTSMKTIERLHKNSLLHRERIVIKVQYRESVALQILLCTKPWYPGIDAAALYMTQSQLPTLPDLENINLNPPKQLT